MRVISKPTLRNFWELHADTKQQLLSWYRETENTRWENFNDIKINYPSASIIGENRVVFNIRGNNYRVVVKISFFYKMAWIRFIGSHAEYDKIDATKI